MLQARLKRENILHLVRRDWQEGVGVGVGSRRRNKEGEEDEEKE